MSILRIKTADGWVSVPAIAGPKGDKGDKGDTGPQGPKGQSAFPTNVTNDLNSGNYVKASSSEFTVTATSGSNSKSLVGRPDGTLVWNGNRVSTYTVVSTRDRDGSAPSYGLT